MSIEKYQKWRDEKGRLFTPVSVDGLDLISDRTLNKGTAFTKEEREIFYLDGLIPPNVQTLEEQKERVYEGFCSARSDIDKYIYLRSLQDRNETLYYSLLEEHIEEMLPIIYIPTVVTACLQFSHHYQRARGLYITRQNVEKMQEMIHHFPSHDIQVIVVTDSQGILGVKDIGVGGMAIPIGKLSLYTMGSGIHPSNCLPIALDVGTDNEELLADPLYLGVEHKRIRGEEYYAFIERFVENIRKAFPRAILQWEDFNKKHSFTILEKYRETLPSFNDDIQGTGAVVLAGLINAVKIKEQGLKDQVYLIYGAGSGGIGSARQLYTSLVAEGLSPEEAYEKIYVIDSKGLVMEDRPDLEPFKQPFAKSSLLFTNWKFASDQPTLLEIIENSKATVLIGMSGKKEVFKKEHVEAMLKNTDRPVILPLTNPAKEGEAMLDDLFFWSGGKAIVASGGSPWDDIEFEGKTYRIGTATNALIFPGVGLAALISGVKVITDEIFTTAAQALSTCVSQADLKDGVLYPRLQDIQKVGLRVATEVLKAIVKRNPDIGIIQDDIYEIVRSHIWKPIYYPYRRV